MDTVILHTAPTLGSIVKSIVKPSNLSDSEVAEKLDLTVGVYRALINDHQKVTLEWLEERKLIRKLCQFFPETMPTYQHHLQDILARTRSRDDFKGTGVINAEGIKARQVYHDWRLAVGKTLRQIRISQGHSIEDVAGSVPNPSLRDPVLWKDLERGGLRSKSRILNDKTYLAVMRAIAARYKLSASSTGGQAIKTLRDRKPQDLGARGSLLHFMEWGP